MSASCCIRPRVGENGISNIPAAVKSCCRCDLRCSRESISTSGTAAYRMSKDLLVAEDNLFLLGPAELQKLENELFTALYNMTGRPSMSVPLHWTPDGLPVG